ncbi:hypothetical protein [Methylobacterium sp. P1-11]|uniref:hypothetical protein n=1 Tax=Methylobacterium sp. P1-11 TaxID=2024616 RepID=UPI0011EDB399|nr:hypothetical protein [Methylobacterium sp. P1-11]
MRLAEAVESFPPFGLETAKQVRLWIRMRSAIWTKSMIAPNLIQPIKPEFPCGNRIAGIVRA